MKQILAFLIATGFFLQSPAQRMPVYGYELFSPDSSLRLSVKVGGLLSYELWAGSQLLVSTSSVNLQLAGGKQFSEKIAVAKRANNKVSETVTMPIPYKSKTITDNYHQLKLAFKEPFGIEFRLYNNGMAYRIDTRFKDSVTVEKENVSFDVDPGSFVWFANMDKRQHVDRYHTSFEAIYKKQALSDIADTMLTFAPVTVSLPSGYHLSFTDANLYDYPGMFIGITAKGLQGVFAPVAKQEKLMEGEFPQYVVTERENYIAKTNGTRSFPWRAVLVAKNDVDLPANDMVYLLGDKPKFSDVSWIKYGKGTDEWIIGINLFNVPFVAGINTATYKYYIDFAKRFGFDQVMLDAGWSDTKDLFKINPDIDMNELATYAKKNNVRLMLWTLCATLDKQLDSALKQFSQWGIASIMTDFMDRDDQKMVNFYHRIAKACADHQISIMFHGAFPPKGFNRTWPNVLTHEGVLGAEWNIWSELATPEHNVAIAYVRMPAGPLDYEPGLLLNAQKDLFRPIGKNPMSQGTRCHQLAMFAVYESPLQIFSGNPSQGMKEPEFMKLLGSVPTTWDETKYIQGKIGEYIISAKRKGSDWFVAGLNGATAKDISVTMDFLNNDSYNMTLCKDGVNAHNYAADYEIQKRSVNKNEKLDIHLAPGGGFLLKLTVK